MADLTIIETFFINIVGAFVFAIIVHTDIIMYVPDLQIFVLRLITEKTQWHLSAVYQWINPPVTVCAHFIY